MGKTRKSIVAAAIASLLSANPALASGSENSRSGQLFSDLFNTDPCSNISRDWGTLLGSGLGWYLGKKIGDKKASAKLIGVMVGGFIGNAIGRDMDRRRCELHKIAQEHQLDVEFEDVQLATDDEPAPGESNIFGIGALDDPELLSANYVYLASNDLTLSDAGQPGMGSFRLASASDKASSSKKAKGMVSRWKGLQHFATGSDKLTSSAESYFSKIADQYRADKSVEAIENDVRQAAAQQGALPPQDIDRDAIRKQVESIQIVLVGHTDDTGDSEMNQRLSERRARSVAKVFASRGIAIDRIYFRGAGETDPIADNTGAEGRAKNRRVEIVEMPSIDGLTGYISLKKPRYEFYRPRPQGDTTEAATEIEEPDASAEIANPTADATRTSENTVSARPENAAGTGVKPNPVKDQEASTPTKSTERNSTSRISSKRKSSQVSDSGKTTAPTSSSGGEPVSKPGTTTPAQASPQTTIAIRPTPAAEDAKPSVSASNQPVSKPASADSGVFDFGGQRASKTEAMRVVSAMGAARSSSGGSWFKNLNPIGEAVADPVITTTPCYQDSPRVDGDYISLKTAKPIKYHTSEYARGMYGTAWSANVNGHLVGIAPVSVLRTSLKVVEPPKVYVYRDQPTVDPRVKASVRVDTLVNAYPGKDGLLFRIFNKGKAKSFVCQDIVLPTDGSLKAKDGNLYFMKEGQLQAAAFAPEMLVTK